VRVVQESTLPDAAKELLAHVFRTGNVPPRAEPEPA
jgi:hypothetical protein